MLTAHVGSVGEYFDLDHMCGRVNSLFGCEIEIVSYGTFADLVSWSPVS